MNKERVSTEALGRAWPDCVTAHTKAVRFKVANKLDSRLGIGWRFGIGSNIDQELMLEDTLAIEAVSEQVGIVVSKIRSYKAASQSRRHVLGAYTRLRIRQLEARGANLLIAFDYLLEERGYHRDQIARTPEKKKNAGIIIEAVEELIVITRKSGGLVSQASQLNDDDLREWQSKYSGKLSVVT